MGSSPLPPSLANAGGGQLFSLWRASGSPPAGAIPGAAETCTSALTGAFPFTDPASGSSYLGSLQAQMAVIGSVIVYDRLQHMGGLDGTLATEQAVNVAIPANSNAAENGSDVEWFLEWYTATGATSVTATVTYTSQNDVTGRTCNVAVAATARASRLMQILPTLAGDQIKSVQSVTLSVSTGTAGSFGVTVAKRIGAVCAISVGQVITMDALNLGLPVIPNSACLWLVVLCSSTTTGQINGNLAIIQG